MNENKFNKWKEANHWLFQALKDHKELLDQQVSELAARILVCDDAELEYRRRYAAGLAGTAVAYDELSEMDFEFYQQMMGEEE